MPDFPILKFNTLSLDLKKLFDKGQIDRLYEKMYRLAVKIAKEETERYILKINAEDEEREVGLRQKVSAERQSVTRIPNFTDKRIQFHLDNMFRLMELYVKLKSSDSSG
jgi:hypothetical protein